VTGGTLSALLSKYEEVIAASPLALSKGKGAERESSCLSAGVFLFSLMRVKGNEGL